MQREPVQESESEIESYELVSTTTQMLRALNVKIENLLRTSNGNISAESMDEIQRMLQGQTNAIRGHAEANARSVTDSVKNAVAQTIANQMEQWRQRQDAATEEARRQYENLAEELKRLRQRKAVPEHANPLREFTKDGIIETVAANQRLFFPYQTSATPVAPEGTCLLRHVETMEVIHVSAMFADLVRLPKDDPARMLIAHSLIPVGDLPQLRDKATFYWTRLLTMDDVPGDIGMAAFTRFVRLFHPGGVPANMDSDPAVRQKLVLPQSTAHGTQSNYFNATLFLLLGFDIWPIDGDLPTNHVFYQRLMQTTLARQTVHEMDLTPMLPQYIAFLWRCVLVWNAV